MRIEIQGAPGELASRPSAALDALAKAAVEDGADLDLWLEKALAGAGATARAAPVTREPAYQVVADSVEQAHGAFGTVMTMCREAIKERLLLAAREADTTRYLDLLTE